MREDTEETSRLEQEKAGLWYRDKVEREAI